MAHSLDGHVALVTGNTTGLGKAIGMTLGKAGAKVPVNYFNNTERAETTLAEYETAGIDTVLIKSDVTTQEGVAALFSEAESALGIPDIVVPNATCSQPLRPIEEYDWEFYQLMLDFFVKSPYLLARRGLPAMKEKRWGRFISIVSEVYYRSTAPFSAYVAAKGAQIGWSRSMATELAPHGITVNMVAPGWVPVERHEHDPQALKDAYRATIPVDRWGTPEDVADAVLYFAREQASFITGQTLCVNGGLTPH